MANISKDTFDALKHFVSVRLQQGVPIVDADWNEMEDIRRYEIRAFLKWFIGNGVPAGDDGFRISARPDPATPGSFTNDFVIGKGRCLVEGLDVINDNDLYYTEQRLYKEPDLYKKWVVDPLPRLITPDDDQNYTVYLDVWERLVDSSEDHDLINKAIGIETCVRLKHEWVARVTKESFKELKKKKPTGHEYYLLADVHLRKDDKTIGPEDISDKRQIILSLVGFQEIVRVSHDGNVGIGTTAPDAPLHVASYMAVGPFAPTTGSGGIDVTGPVAELGFVRRNLTAWPSAPAAGDRFVWYSPDGSARLWTEAKGDLLTVSKEGNVGIGTTEPRGKLDVNGPIFQRGAQLHGDYVFESDYKLESIQEHAKFMWKNKHLKAIQPRTTDESGLEVVEVGAHFKGIVEELEKAHIYIEQLHQQNKALEEKLTKFSALEAKLESLEKLLLSNK